MHVLNRALVIIINFVNDSITQKARPVNMLSHARPLFAINALREKRSGTRDYIARHSL